MIRELRDTDFEKIYNLMQQVHLLHLSARPDIYKNGDVLSKEYFNELITNENLLNFVYEEGNNIIGLILASKMKKGQSIPIMKLRNIIYIDSLVVDESHRHKGIGKSLYQFILNIAKKENMDSIELNAWTFNKNAIKFYKSLGLNEKTIKFEQKIK